MRAIGVLIITFGLSAGAVAQDRLVTLGHQGPYESEPPIPTLLETEIDGTTIGPTRVLTTLPPHAFRTHQLVSMAGARYVAWLAATVSGPFSVCREFVAVFDRRLRTARVVPNVELPCGIAQLVGDPRRPRLFLHTWTTINGLPGTIASIDEDLTVRPIVVSNRLGTAFAYAADADQLLVTELGPMGDPTLSVVAFSAATGERLHAFPARDALNVSTAQMQVTADGRRVFVWTSWGRLLPFEHEIRVFDVQTGVETAASQPVYLGGGGGDKLVLDEPRNLILTPHNNTFEYQLIAFDATTLEFFGKAHSSYPPAITFQSLRGRGTAAAYLVFGGQPPFSSGCGVWLDAFDAGGTVRMRAELPQLANSYCSPAVIMLSPPAAPSDLSASVVGRRVTLTWTNPGDTSEFELEAGAAPGRRDLATRAGLVTEFSVNDVPPGIYYVRVRGINEIGTSPFSNEVRVVVP